MHNYGMPGEYIPRSWSELDRKPEVAEHGSGTDHPGYEGATLFTDTELEAAAGHPETPSTPDSNQTADLKLPLPYAALSDMVEDIHATAVEKGWWEPQYLDVNPDSPYRRTVEVPRNFGEVLALIHSEVSEVLEAYRDGMPINEHKYQDVSAHCGDYEAVFDYPGVCDGEEFKPVGVPSEMADIFIRLADACGAWGIDLGKAVAEKVAYNKTREYRHGGKLA